MTLNHIKYKNLNARQKERYNFQKIAGLLADYGFACLKLDDDWQGADFIAHHVDGKTFMKVQLKGRLHFDRKYKGKEIYMAFPYKQDWYLLNHDEVLETFLHVFANTMAQSVSWKQRGIYNWNGLSPKILKLIKPYKLSPSINNEQDQSIT